MITNTHKQSIEFSGSLSFCILIGLLVGSGSTAASLTYSSPGSGWSSSSNSTGNSASGGSVDADAGLKDSSGSGSSSKIGSGDSGPSDVSSESSGSGSSGNSNSTGTTGGRSQDNSIGSVSNGRGATEYNNTNSGKSVIQRSTQCDIPNPSCSTSTIEMSKNAPGNTCSPRDGKELCTSYAERRSSNDMISNQNNESSSNINPSSSPAQTNTTHCDQPGSPSCYRLGFQDGKTSAGTSCPTGHSTNYCSGWKVGSQVTGLGTIREIAPGAPAGSHTLEYIQAFNTASGNPYKSGSKQYEDYQGGLKDAKKAGRDCDKMDTCGGPDLLGNYVNGALHLSDKQYCGKGFGVYSTKLCKFPKGCIATIIGTVTCPSSELPLPENAHIYWGK